MLLSIDSIGSVIESLVSLDWLLEVSAFLWNVLFDDGSISQKCKLKIQEHETEKQKIL